MDKQKTLKITLLLRVSGFVLIIVAFLMAIMLRNGHGALLGFNINRLTFILSVAGFILYAGSRIFEIVTKRSSPKQ